MKIPEKSTYAYILFAAAALAAFALVTALAGPGGDADGISTSRLHGPLGDSSNRDFYRAAGTSKKTSTENENARTPEKTEKTYDPTGLTTPRKRLPYRDLAERSALVTGGRRSGIHRIDRLQHAPGALVLRGGSLSSLRGPSALKKASTDALDMVMDLGIKVVTPEKKKIEPLFKPDGEDQADAVETADADDEEEKPDETDEPGEVKHLSLDRVIETVALWPGEPGAFSARAASGNESRIAVYQWDFDASDGVDLENGSAETTHAYALPGLYTVTVGAIDENGGLYRGSVQVPVAEEIDLPAPSSLSYSTTATVLADGRLLAFDGAVVHLQDRAGFSAFTPVARIPDGEAADPAFVRVAPDGNAVYLGAGAGGKKPEKSNGKIWSFNLSDCGVITIVAQEKAVIPFHYDLKFAPDGKIYVSHNPGYSGKGESANRISLVDEKTWKTTEVVRVPGPSCGFDFDDDKSVYLGGTTFVFPAPPGAGTVWRFQGELVDKAAEAGALTEKNAALAAGGLTTTQKSLAIDNRRGMYLSGRYDGEAPIRIDLDAANTAVGDDFPRLVSRHGREAWETPYFSGLQFQKKRNTLGAVFGDDCGRFRALLVKLPDPDAAESAP